MKEQRSDLEINNDNVEERLKIEVLYFYDEQKRFMICKLNDSLNKSQLRSLTCLHY